GEQFAVQPGLPALTALEDLGRGGGRGRLGDLGEDLAGLLHQAEVALQRRVRQRAPVSAELPRPPGGGQGLPGGAAGAHRGIVPHGGGGDGDRHRDGHRGQRLGRRQRLVGRPRLRGGRRGRRGRRLVRVLGGVGDVRQRFLGDRRG